MLLEIIAITCIHALYVRVVSLKKFVRSLCRGAAFSSCSSSRAPHLPIQYMPAAFYLGEKLPAARSIATVIARPSFSFVLSFSSSARVRPQ